eukprot:CAMPEP_0201475714 /NCGR_PEP_ID=MMETSP0151_2-20130828/1082_1 /ASSEMBLY_ACC=CAM_ASM_000257 /TAXON_ID=200890 /ORGANISM="Paramoeba atlantica, Strain 621/1 / CCAP 1560/9" /LENGTH=135 /DNA_ID=CAMNT_0047855877 /DNA_START=236 /DNA_END=643 /DNA_ORIENTATION=+
MKKLDEVESYLMAEFLQIQAGFSDEQISAHFANLGGSGQVIQTGTPGAGGEAEEAEESAPEQTVFKLKITAVNDFEKNKFKLIKAIRTLKPGEPLEQSKGYVTQLPSVLMEDVAKEEAEKIQSQLAENGAVIELV